MWTRRNFSIAGLALVGIVASASIMSSPSSGYSGGPDTTCVSSAPCLAEVNHGTGEGALGIAKANNGLHGETVFVSTPSLAKAGVLGEDLSASGTRNAGVLGATKRGIGVLGSATVGTGMRGTATLGTGVIGLSQKTGISGISTGGGVGVAGTSSGIGVSGTSTNASAGVFGSTVSGQGVEGVATANGYGMFGTATNGGIGIGGSGSLYGVEGFNTNVASSAAFYANGSGGNLFVGHGSGGQDVLTIDNFGRVTSADIFVGTGGSFVTTNSLGVFAEGASSGIESISTDPSALLGAVFAQSHGGYVYEGRDGNDNQVFLVDPTGNITITGKIYTAGGCSSGCAIQKGLAKRVVSYAPREAQPSMEDFGEAQLVDGQAQVRIDVAFANVIDQRANYLVFITPEGESRGLYVVNKTPAGFTVRENQSGRATIPFSYRIVARPFGDTSPRLPATVMRAPALAKLHARHP